MPSNLQNVDPKSSKMFLLKGKFGTGKSPAAASFPKPLYFFDFDRRMDSVKKIFPHEKEIYYDTYADFGKAGYKKFADMLESFTDKCPYQTVVLPDSLTNFVELVMNHFIKLRGAGKLSEMEGEEKSPKKKTKSKGSIELLGIDDYAAETRAISEMLSNAKYLADQGVNIVTIAHIITTQTTNIQTGRNTVEKFLLTYGKKAAGKIPTLYGEIYHFETEESIDTSEGTRYIVTTENTSDDFARTSFHMEKRIDWTNKNFYKEISQYFSVVKDSPMEIIEDEHKIQHEGGIF